MRFVNFYAIAIGASLALASPAMASPKDGEKSGDWTFQCAQADKKKPQICQLVQSQSVKDQQGNEGRLLQLTILRAPDKSLIMHAVLPLGLHIPAGVAMKIDEGDQTPMSLQRCLKSGCEAIAKIDNAMLAKLKKGKSLKIGFRGGDKTMVIPASLKGFSAGADKL